MLSVIDTPGHFVEYLKGSDLGRKADHFQRTYKYLLETRLLTKYNPEQFRRRVKEIYFEYLAQTDMPSMIDIAYDIDNENTILLTEFYCSNDYEETEIDMIQALYFHDISCMTDVWVEEALLDMLGSQHMYSGDSFKILSLLGDEGSFKREQNIIFKGFLGVWS